MLDLKLLYDFRVQLRAHNWWCLFRYSSDNSKKDWNCICSATDWIEVASNYILSHPLCEIRGRCSIELFSYLACVDLIVESIEQLHRVIFQTGDKKKDKVFFADSTCFLNNSFHMNDREYFKKLRGCFGAHPVDVFDVNDKSAKRYASWSYGDDGPGDFSVIIYNNEPNGQDTYIGLHYDQLIAFTDKYYNHLLVIKNQLEIQYNEFFEKKRNETIPIPNDRASQIAVLERENIDRCNNEYLNKVLKKLRLIYSVDIANPKNTDLVEIYRDALGSVVDEIHFKLQNMDLEFSCLDNVSTFNPQTDCFPNWFYDELDEIEDNESNTNISGIICVSFDDELHQLFGKMFEYDYNSVEELYVLVKSALYRLAMQKETLGE